MLIAILNIIMLFEFISYFEIENKYFLQNDFLNHWIFQKMFYFNV